MDKPISDSLVYRKKDTATPGYEFQSVPTVDEINSMQSTVEFILNSIVAKHS